MKCLYPYVFRTVLLCSIAIFTAAAQTVSAQQHKNRLSRAAVDARVTKINAMCKEIQSLIMTNHVNNCRNVLVHDTMWCDYEEEPIGLKRTALYCKLPLGYSYFRLHEEAADYCKYNPHERLVLLYLKNGIVFYAYEDVNGPFCLSRIHIYNSEQGTTGYVIKQVNDCNAYKGLQKPESIYHNSELLAYQEHTSTIFRELQQLLKLKPSDR